MNNSQVILAVDDSRLSRRTFVAKPLRESGYTVFEAENGVKGLEAYDAHAPDLIVTDLLMPEMDGFEFIAALRAKGATCPIIVASADIQDTSRQRIEDLNTSAFINKPFKADQLVELVQQTFGEPV